MNVLLIELNESYGGSVAFLLDVINFYIERNYNVSLIINKNANWSDKLRHKRIKVFKLRSYPWVRSMDMKWSITNDLKAGFKAILNFLSEIKIYFLILLCKYDHVYINTAIYPSGYLSCRLLNVFQVLNLHEFLDLDHRLQFIWPKFAETFLNFSKAILFNSSLVRMHFFSRIPKKHLDLLIRNGFDVAKFKKHGKYVSGGQIKIAILGRLVKSKGQMDLVLAAAYLKKWGITNFIIEVYGDINEDYAQIIKSKILFNSLQDLVILKGFCVDIHSLLSEVDILCVCSRYEAFGRVTLEGMLASCCVVGAKAGTTANLINNFSNGILYEVGDPLSLANVLSELILSPYKIQELGERGREFANENFSIGAMYTDLEKFLALKSISKKK